MACFDHRGRSHLCTAGMHGGLPRHHHCGAQGKDPKDAKQCHFRFEGVNVENIKLQVDRFIFPDGHGVIVLVSGRQQILTTDSMPDLIQVNRALTQGSLPSLHEGFDRGSSGCSDGLRSADGSASQEANGSYMSESSDHPTGPLTPTERCCQMRHR